MAASGRNCVPINGAPETGLDNNKIWIWARRRAIWKVPELSLGARACWLIVEAFSGDCFASHWYLAEELHKSVSAVRRYLNELKRKGYIEIVPRFDAQRTSRGRPRRGQTSNIYRILDQPELIAFAKQLVQDWRARNPQE